MFKIAQPCSEKNTDKKCDGPSCSHHKIAIRSPNSPVKERKKKDATIKKKVMEEMEKNYDPEFLERIKIKRALFEERLKRRTMQREEVERKLAMIRKARREEMEEKERKKEERLRKRAERREKKELEKAAKRNETLYKTAEIQTLPSAKVRKSLRKGKGKGSTIKRKAVIGPRIARVKKLKNEKNKKAAQKKRDEKPVKRPISVPKSSAKSLVGLTLHQKIAMEKAKKKKMSFLKKRNAKALKKFPRKKEEKPKTTTKSSKLKMRPNDQTKNAKKKVKKSFIQINRENVGKFSFIKTPKDSSKKPMQSMATKNSRKELNEAILQNVVKIEVPKCETKNEKKANDVPKKSEIKILTQINPPVLDLATSTIEVKKKILVDKAVSPKESFSEFPLNPNKLTAANLKWRKNRILQKKLNALAKKSQVNKSLKNVKPPVKKFDYEAYKLQEKLNYEKEMAKFSPEENARLKRERNLKRQLISEASWKYKRISKPKVESPAGKTEKPEQKGQESSKKLEHPKSSKKNPIIQDLEKKLAMPKPILRSNLRKNLEKIVGSKNDKALKLENDVLKKSSIGVNLKGADQKRLTEKVLNLAATIYHGKPCKFEKFMMDNIKKSATPYLKKAKTALSQREHSKESIISILMNILHSGYDETKQGKRVNEIPRKSYAKNPHNVPSPIEILGQFGERPRSCNLLQKMKEGAELTKRNLEDRFNSDEKEKDALTLEEDKSAEGEEEEKPKKTEAEYLAEVAQKLSMKADNLAKSNKLYDSEMIFAQLSSPAVSPTTGRRSFFKKKVPRAEKKKAKKEKRSRSCRGKDDYSETDSSTSLESLNSQGYRESDLIQIKGVEHEPMILTTYKNTQYKVVTPLKDLLRERNKSRLPDDPTNERGFYGFSTELFWANQRTSSDSD